MNSSMAAIMRSLSSCLASYETLNRRSASSTKAGSRWLRENPRNREPPSFSQSVWSPFAVIYTHEVCTVVAVTGGVAITDAALTGNKHSGSGETCIGGNASAKNNVVPKRSHACRLPPQGCWAADAVTNTHTRYTQRNVRLIALSIAER